MFDDLDPRAVEGYLRSIEQEIVTINVLSILNFALLIIVFMLAIRRKWPQKIMTGLLYLSIRAALREGKDIKSLTDRALDAQTEEQKKRDRRKDKNPFRRLVK